MMPESKKTPLISVVMPAYNAAEFIEQAIESVLQQTVTDLELIVVDDCSKDQTCQLVTRLQEQDPRVKLVVNEKNLGAGGTRNHGLDESRGQYVALLDSDDYWMPQLLEKLLQCLEKTGADIAYCSYSLVDEQGKKVCNDFIVPEQTDFEHSAVRNVISCSTAMLTRDLVDQYRFPAGLYHEDIALWFRMLLDGKTARGVPQVLACYRQRANSKTSGKFKTACRRWIVYRDYLKLPLLQSAGFMISYAYYGVRKYKRI